MTLPKDAELLGASSDELEIKGPGAHTVVRLNTRLGASSADNSERAPRGRVYLTLENIRGTHDATVLNVYVNLPEGALPGEHRNLLAGSVGLYGLRRASIGQGEADGSGLAFVLEITRVLNELSLGMSFDPGSLRISILPQRGLPDSAGIVVGQVRIFRLSP